MSELEHAAHVLGRKDLDAASGVAVGVRHGDDAGKLPPIDVKDVEADAYYKTGDGVLHLDEVKDTPIALAEKLKGEKQFERYKEWQAKGKDRAVGVSVQATKPKFYELLSKENLEKLQLICPNPKVKNIRIGGREFSLDELKKMGNGVYKKYQEIKRGHPKLGMADILNKHFDSLEQIEALLKQGTP